MARGPENIFIASIHRLLPKAIYALKNHNEYNGGIADVWYDGPQGDLWVEYKFITVPKRDDTIVKIDLSELQKSWLHDRHKNGRNVAVIVGCKDGGVWSPGMSWDVPLTAKQFREELCTRQQLARLINEYTCRG